MAEVEKGTRFDIIQWYKDNGFAFLTVEQAVPLPTT